MSDWTRRRFFRTGATAAAALGGLSAGRSSWADRHTEDGWEQGDLMHLVPGANHERIVVKCSFRSPRPPPLLRIDGVRFAARTTDSEARYFAFDAPGLQPDHAYTLRLVDAEDAPLTDPWPLKTYPAPDAQPDSVRLLAYTCAGGYPSYASEPQPFLSPRLCAVERHRGAVRRRRALGRWGLGPNTEPSARRLAALALRRRLLARALSFAPDAAIAIGDHVYWDQRTQLDSARADVRQRAHAWYASRGMLDRGLPAKGTVNEAAIKNAVEPQFAELYGVMLRSTPSYFVSDDHDYYENDEATDRFVTLPPHAYQLSFARFTRDLFMPEFLPDPERPTLMSGAGAGDRGAGISESFGTFRYGNLAEALIYDCARFLSLKGDVGGLVPPEAEAWLKARTADQRVRHVFHVPSHPFGWTAGKWREWYPDVADVGEGNTAVAQIRADGGDTVRLTTKRRKFHWQRGWFLQHQRLLASLAGQPERAGIVLSGDLHATGHVRIRQSADLDFRNPVHAILTGPLGTGLGWPSRARGTPPLIATGLEVDELAGVREKNGFTLLDIDAGSVTVRLFEWRRGEPEAAIDTLEPYHTHTIRR